MCCCRLQSGWRLRDKADQRAPLYPSWTRLSSLLSLSLSFIYSLVYLPPPPSFFGRGRVQTPPHSPCPLALCLRVITTTSSLLDGLHPSQRAKKKNSKRGKQGFPSSSFHVDNNRMSPRNVSITSTGVHVQFPRLAEFVNNIAKMVCIEYTCKCGHVTAKEGEQTF